MTVSRTLTALLVLNLFATLLVFRGMLVLSERTNRPCAEMAVSSVLSRGGEGVEERPAAAIEVPLSGPQGRPARASTRDVVDRHPGHGDFADTAIELVADDLDGIRSQFAGEYTDAGWTSSVLNSLQGIGGGSLEFAGITQDLVDCRERICRLELRYSDAVAFDEYVGQLTLALQDERSVSLYFGEPSTLAGNSTVALFVVRE